ncbi:hypothetical protein [Bradyrhizobium septentrionale]|uniref:Uncharacterized protein n=1 Tax=Bradyrhizobium septentrionale TaxID=1404411 RepID=A0ABZ2NPP7_9BRAD
MAGSIKYEHCSIIRRKMSNVQVLFREERLMMLMGKVLGDLRQSGNAAFGLAGATAAAAPALLHRKAMSAQGVSAKRNAPKMC